MSKNTENFAQLLEESLAESDLSKGALVKATVVEIKPNYIVVNAGLKSDAVIPLSEFNKDETVNVGDEIDAVVKSVENGFGETRLSYEDAKRRRVWADLAVKHEAGEIVMGVITERVKGGFTVELDGVRAFLPGSLVDVKPVRDPSYLEGKPLEFKVIKMDQRRNNIVVSRRAVMEAETSADRQAILEQLQEGQEVAGVVKNITDYGAFVDLGGVDGLLHITDMAWKRVKHPSELMTVGDEIKVKVLKIDTEKNRVSLGLKQMAGDPWANIAGRYPAATRLTGKVTNITDYGCFVELEEGVEGLVHMSEMDWTNKNIHPSKIVSHGDEVEVMVLDIDEERRRISLGIKQCKQNPWQEFSESHHKGDKVSGKIRSITDFGVFVGLTGDIDGLIHLSDLSWMKAGEDAVRDFKKGDELEAVILAIDPERERISLGIKQLETDPLAQYIEQQGGQDAKITVKVKTVDAKQATFDLAEDVSGIMHVAEYSQDHVKDLSSEISEGEELEVRISGVDRKTHAVSLSRKDLEKSELKQVQKAAVKEMPSKTTLGDLLKEQMQDKDGK